MKFINYLLLSVFFLSFCSIDAQKKLTEATLSFELDEISSDDPQANAQIQMMKGSKMTVHIMGEKQLTEMDMMNGMMQQKIIANTKTSEMEMFMDAMGRKIRVKMPMDQEQNKEVETNIEYFKDETKEIAGYETYKAVITNNVEGNKVEIQTYITEEFELDGDIIRSVEGTEKLKGIPLEYSIAQQGMTMRFTCKEIKESVDEKVFDFDTAGYEEMDPEDLQNMGGMGF